MNHERLCSALSDDLFDQIVQKIFKSVLIGNISHFLAVIPLFRTLFNVRNPDPVRIRVLDEPKVGYTKYVQKVPAVALRSATQFGKCIFLCKEYLNYCLAFLLIRQRERLIQIAG